MRLPVAMYPVALVLLTSLRSEGYGLGGALTAGYIIGTAAGNPLLSRLADRLGQRAVLLPAAAVHAAAVCVLLSAVSSGRHTVVLVAAAVVIGLSFPPVGALVRARWATLLTAFPHGLTTGLAVESTVDEITFVVGPVVATALATTVAPTAPFVVAVVLVLFGGAGLHLLRSTTPVVHRGHAAASERLFTSSTVVLVLVMVAAGTMLIAIDLSAIAFVGQAGYTSWTGGVLACFAAGSGAASLVYGARRWNSTPEDRLRWVSVVFALLPVLLLVTVDVATLAVLLLVIGLGTAPMLITVFSVLERVVPPARVTEGMALLTTGLSIGAGAAAPLVGAAADAYGARFALAIPVCAAVVAGVMAQAAARLVRRQVAQRA